MFYATVRVPKPVLLPKVLILYISVTVIQGRPLTREVPWEWN
jgi:hypothetical protein